jgi:membrane protein
MILMLLIYINSLILLIGFELNLSITFLKTSSTDTRLEETRKLTNTKEAIERK